MSVSIGIWTSFFVTAQIELSYHWAPGRVEIKGTSSGLPFRRVENERNEWISLCISFGF